MAKLITSDAFIKWLSRNGIVPENTRRVVIDAEVQAPVKIYIEQFGTTALIEVEPPSELITAIRIVNGKQENA